MAKKYRAHNSIISFVALAMILYFVGLPLFVALLSNVFGSKGDVITNMIGVIPFGKTYYEISIQLLGAIGGQVVSSAEAGSSLKLSYLLGELAEELFIIIIFEALNLAAYTVMGLKGEKGRWNIAKKMLVSVINALAAACICPFLLDYITDSFDSIGTAASGIISAFISVILLGGGTFFFSALFGIGVGAALLFVLIRFLLMGAVRLAISYISLFLLILGWQSGAFYQIAGGISGLLGIALLLGGIELAIDSALGR